MLASALFAMQWQNARALKNTVAANPQRIVSLAPAITETLYALGLGKRIAGVTEFCTWPDDATRKPKVGGFHEINLEAIARTGADLVIMPTDMAHFKKLVEDIGIPVLLFDTQSLDGFLRDVQALGKLSATKEAAEELTTNFVSARTQTRDNAFAPRVLIALMNPDEFQRPLIDLTVIGKDGFYDELIKVAGGKNAYDGTTAFPRMSLESIIVINPDVIVVAAPDAPNIEKLKARWNSIEHLQAIRNGHFLIFNDPGDTVPGPRALGTLKKITSEISRITAVASGGNR